jgi:hypothetical protein
LKAAPLERSDHADNKFVRRSLNSALLNIRDRAELDTSEIRQFALTQAGQFPRFTQRHVSHCRQYSDKPNTNASTIRQFLMDFCWRWLT